MWTNRARLRSQRKPLDEVSDEVVKACTEMDIEMIDLPAELQGAERVVEAMHPTYNLGTSAPYHESAACLVPDGEIAPAAQVRC